MIRVKRWRFYCEHCGKSSGSGGHLSRHEKRCTANPDRRCGMCGKGGIVGLIEALGNGDEDGLDRLREATDGCPACMLAAIRQSKLQFYDSGEDGDASFRVEFDFRKEKSVWWAAKNEASLAREYHEMGY